MIPQFQKNRKRPHPNGFSCTPASNTGVKVTNEVKEPESGYYPKPVLEQLGVTEPTKRKGIFPTAPRPKHLNGELGVDWLTVTCHDFPSLQDVRYNLETKFFGVDFVPVPKRLDFYTNCLENELGVLILYSKEGQRNSWHYTIKFPGKALKYLAQEKLFQLLRYLYVKRFTSSRLDVHLDIFKLPEPFQSTNEFLREVKTCLQTSTDNGKLVTGVRKWRDYSENEVGNNQVTGLGLGSRQSECFIRMYDKAIESGLDLTAEQLQVPCPTWLRIEAELKAELANIALIDLVLGVQDNPEAQHKALKKVALGVINRLGFWDRKSKNLGRCELLPWWQQITDSVQKFKRTTAKHKPTIDKKIAWINKQVAPWFAAICLATEGEDGQGFKDIIQALITDGIGRLQDKHYLAVTEHELLTATST